MRKTLFYLIMLLGTMGFLSTEVLQAQCPNAPPDPTWTITTCNAASNHTVTINPAFPNGFVNDIDGAGTMIAAGDYIGAFYLDDNGVLTAAGWEQWTGGPISFPVRGNEPTTATDGYTVGDDLTLVWYLWDSSAGAAVGPLEAKFHPSNFFGFGLVTDQNIYAVNGSSAIQSFCLGGCDACGVCGGPGEITYYEDAEGDGFGDPNVSMMSCTQPAGFVTDMTDLCPLVAGILPGCTDMAATNFNSAANCDDGSCILAACNTGLVINEIDYDQAGSDMAEYIELYNSTGAAITLGAGDELDLINGAGGGSVSYATIPLNGATIPAGGYYVVCFGSNTAAYCDVTVAGSIQNGAPDALALVNNGMICDAVSYEGDVPGYTEGTGAPTDGGDGSIGRDNMGTDSGDNSADFSLGCSSPGAANETASCAGCTDDTACNYDPNAITDDASCEFLTCAGCTDMTACNYDMTATIDDASCIAAPTCNTDACMGDIEGIDPMDACSCIVIEAQVNGCTDALATNYNMNANCDDGSCMFTMGCTDPTFCNYEPTATVDDGSCSNADPGTTPVNSDICMGDIVVWNMTTCAYETTTVQVLGCTDMNANNYNPMANCDDGSCASCPSLVINEIDYDQPSTDTAEYIELYNGSGSMVTLGATDELQLINGNGSVVYETVNLSGAMIPAGGYYVVCFGGNAAAYCDVTVAGSIQNGAPDGVALVNSGTICDAVSYEGDIPGYTEGTGAPTDSGDGSIGRDAMGTDSGDNSADFSLGCSSPGAANETSSCGGCTDNTACNYDADAVTDDGSCEFLTCAGCTDATACNYDMTATIDDMSCMPVPTCNTDPCVGDIEGIDPMDACNCIVVTPQVLGCTNVAATNYNMSANCDDGSCVLPTTGCTDATACNYNMNAMMDDGSCEFLTCAGCTDATACNYDMTATIDDMSCIAPPTCNTDPCMGDVEGVDPMDACNCVVVTPQVNGCTDATATNYNMNANCDDGSCTFTMGCTDPMACNYNAMATVDDGSCIAPPTCNTDPCMGDIQEIDPMDACNCIVVTPQINGCTDATATNYNMNANCDDGSCTFTMGCTDPTACNYDAGAIVDDGSCNNDDPMTGNTDICAGDTEVWNPTTCMYDVAMVQVNGCTAPTATNYDPTANCDDGTCMFSEGCTDPTACNYNAMATVDDGSCNNDDPMTGNTDICAGDTEVWNAVTCVYDIDVAQVLGCTDVAATNYDATANCDDGSCVLPTTGCTDMTACNYNSNAMVDDGSCEFTSCAGCTDATACNYDMTATIDDASCIFTVGGTISTTDATTICVDGTPDPINVDLVGNVGTNGQWVITDATGTILDLPPSPPFDLDGAGPGVCLIWYIAYEDITGVALGNNATTDLDGCYSLSNSITVTRNEPMGGTITTNDPTTICAGDGIANPINVELTGNVGTNSAWVITDATGTILDLPPSPPFDLDGAGAGVCLIWHVAYEDITGVAVGNNANTDLAGCYSLSNPITVTRFSGNDCTFAIVSTAPCNCYSLDNYVINEQTYFYGTINITSGPNEVWTIDLMNSSGLLDNTGNTLTTPPTATEVSSGVYELNFWHLEGAGYSASFSNGVSVESASGSCAPCEFLPCDESIVSQGKLLLRQGALYGITEFNNDGDEVYTWYNENGSQVAQFTGYEYYSPSSLGSYTLVVYDPDEDCIEIFAPRLLNELDGCCELDDE